MTPGLLESWGSLTPGLCDSGCCDPIAGLSGCDMRINTAPLSAEEQETLRRLVAPRGAQRAAVELGVSREVILSALGGLNLRRGSLALLHAALAPHLAASPSPSAAA